MVFFCCEIVTLGLEKEYQHEVYGMDSIQALHIACDIGNFIKRINKRFDIYWLDGQKYFE